MIHNVELSPIIRDHLTEIVQLQIDLLYYAASEDKINQSTCIDYLNRRPRDPRFKGRGKAIADWLWARGTTIRHNHLIKFGTTYSSTDPTMQQKERKRKQDWCLRLEKEVAMLSNLHLSHIEIASFFEDKSLLLNFNEQTVRQWEGEANSFFLYFYENFLEGDDAFPADLFPTRTSFGRQDFLKAFMKENVSVEICAICDEGRYYTQGKGYIYASVDHYLPKSLYPHLACHPYNLVPICHACNSSLKERKDPLLSHGKRRSLNRYSLPYRKVNWGNDAYLEIQLGKEVAFSTLCSRKDASGQIDPQKQEALQLLSELFDIPGRWQAGKISETLFRRMSQFLGNGKGAPQSFNMPTEINNVLEQLLYYLDQEDRQKDPFAFAMTWVLVAIMDEQIQPLIDGKQDVPSPLIDEIMSWFGQDPAKNHNRAEITKRLRAVPK